MIIDHDDRDYRRRLSRSGGNRYNGAFYYSKEIVKNIIPNVDTDRNWVTVNQVGKALDHSIVFVHNNLHPEHYEWLRRYDDVLLVCGVPSTVDKVSHIARAVYLPLSVDVKYVEQFKREQDRDTAFFGRRGKANGHDFGDSDVIFGIPREKMLPLMARYRHVYAVGRTAIEAKILCGEDSVLPYDPRFPDPSVWEVLDNREAAAMLQDILDDYDGRKQ